MKIYRDFDLSGLTTFGIGGKAEEICFPCDVTDVYSAIETDKKITYFGGGSNVLISDKGIKGRVICMKDQRWGWEVYKKNSARANFIGVSVPAGMKTARVAQIVWKNGLSGMEWGVCVPGTIGGAVVMNASYDKGIKHCIGGVGFVGLSTGKRKYISKKEMGDWSKSRYTLLQDENWIIVSVGIELKEDNKVNIKKRMMDKIKKKSKEQPIHEKSAGCVFKDPNFMLDIKPFKIGGAYISEKDQRYICNDGTATAEDVMRVIGEITEISGQPRELEIKLLGDF